MLERKKVSQLNFSLICYFSNTTVFSKITSWTLQSKLTFNWFKNMKKMLIFRVIQWYNDLTNDDYDPWKFVFLVNKSRIKWSNFDYVLFRGKGSLKIYYSREFYLTRIGSKLEFSPTFCLRIAHANWLE